MKIYTEPKTDETEEYFRVFAEDGNVVVIYEEPHVFDEWIMEPKLAYQFSIALRNAAMQLIDLKEMEKTQENDATCNIKSLINFVKKIHEEFPNGF